ncbi:MAG: YjgN family protein [Pseudomonadota bacterium]
MSGAFQSERSATKPFIFHGNAREYFGIWIVNVLLTIVTLGIYSAWAKVRRNRYFYGNAELDGARFTYLATPIQILIGRIIVVVALVVFNLIATFAPALGAVLLIVLLFVFPELVRRGLRFNARTTAYRNVRFDFAGNYGGAFIATIAGPLLAAFTLGLAAPLASKWTQNYILSNLTFGGRSFSHSGKTGQYYGAFWLPFFLFIGGIALIVVIGIAAAPLFEALENAPDEAAALLVLLPLLPIYFLLLFIFGGISLIYAAGVRNVAFNATTLDNRHQLKSSIGRWQYVWVMVSNFVVTVLTLGLMRPWAAVRHARFLAGGTSMNVQGSLATYSDQLRDAQSSVGAEYMDIEGVEIGL